MTVSCSVCLTAAAIVSETDERTGQTFWLCPACWIEYLHGLDDTDSTKVDPDPDPDLDLDLDPGVVVAGGQWVCPRCQHRQPVAA
jgi:rubrerythrin